MRKLTHDLSCVLLGMVVIDKLRFPSREPLLDTTSKLGAFLLIVQPSPSGFPLLLTKADQAG